jgi:hypothetical protein
MVPTPSVPSLEASLSPKRSAVVSRVRSNPGHASVGAGTLGAVILSIQSHEWVTAAVGVAGLLPPVAVFFWHVGLRNFWGRLLNGDPAETQQA